MRALLIYYTFVLLAVVPGCTTTQRGPLRKPRIAPPPPPAAAPAPRREAPQTPRSAAEKPRSAPIENPAPRPCDLPSWLPPVEHAEPGDKL